VTKFIRKTPCAVLLAVQFLGVLLYPLLEGSLQSRQLFALFGLVVLALVVFALRSTPALTWVAGLLAVPAVVLLFVQIATGNENLIIWASIFEALLYFYGAGAMMLYMLDDEVVTTDELFAIGAVFTLLAWAFAHTYVVLQGLQPTAFGDASEPRGWHDLLFLSFTTLSSTGMSSFVPSTGYARSINMIEQVSGIFYMAMVVTRLVNLRRRHRI
jgi:hypothetical protein